MKILLNRDAHARCKAGDITFCMDSGHLLIQIGKNEDAQYSLSVQETHQLYNLLYSYRQDIYDANVAAKEYGTANRRHKKKDMQNALS